MDNFLDVVFEEEDTFRVLNKPTLLSRGIWLVLHPTVHTDGMWATGFFNAKYMYIAGYNYACYFYNV